MKTTGYSFILLICFMFTYPNAHANNPEHSLYYLCGSDEDGCIDGSYQYCACITANVTEAQKPYCLDFVKMICQPLSQVGQCDEGFTFRNQGSCLATLYQSEPDPPCKLTTYTFCHEHHTYFCDENGRFDSCHSAL